MPKPPEKAIRFHRLYLLRSAQKMEVIDCDWLTSIAPLIGRPPAEMEIDRSLFDPREASNGRMTLGMHRPIDTAFMSRIADDGTVGDLLASDSGATRFAHSSAVAFLDGLAVVAFAKGGQSAPGLDALTDFLDAFLSPGQGAHWKHEPLIDTPKLEEFKKADGVTKFSARFTTMRDLFTDNDSGLLDMADQIAARIGGDIEVSIEIKTVPEASKEVKRNLKGLITRALPRLGSDRRSRPRVTATFPSGLSEELDLIAGHLGVVEPLDAATSERSQFSDLIELVASVGAAYEDRVRRMGEGG